MCQVGSVIQNARKLPSLQGEHFCLENNLVATHLSLGRQRRVRVFADFIPGEEPALLALKQIQPDEFDGDPDSTPMEPGVEEIDQVVDETNDMIGAKGRQG